MNKTECKAGTTANNVVTVVIGVFVLSIARTQDLFSLSCRVVSLDKNLYSIFQLAPLTLLLPRVPKMRIQDKSQISFCKI